MALQCVLGRQAVARSSPSFLTLIQEYTADHRGREIELVQWRIGPPAAERHVRAFTESVASTRRRRRPSRQPIFLISDHPSFGSRVVDHSATSARSRNVTVSCPVAPLILTWPKNCIPAVGGRFCLSSPGALMNFTSGPKVLSSSFGPKVPACNGPETNSQNGSKS